MTENDPWVDLTPTDLVLFLNAGGLSPSTHPKRRPFGWGVPIIFQSGGRYCFPALPFLLEKSKNCDFFFLELELGEGGQSKLLLSEILQSVPSLGKKSKLLLSDFFFFGIGIWRGGPVKIVVE